MIYIIFKNLMYQQQQLTQQKHIQSASNLYAE
jgi:hypothetical protein